MERLAALIHNYNTDCYKQYTKVSNYLGNRLDESLREIERFYYSDFWIKRYERRLREVGFRFYPLELDCILGMITELRENSKFKLFSEPEIEQGRSNNDTMIALNINISKEKLNDSHINNVIMHEFGHRQYNQQQFRIVCYLNKLIIDDPSKHIKNNQTLSDRDLSYFTDDNELRQRVIPIVKEMRDNRWTIGETYDNSVNLAQDDIKDIFEREYILKLLDNLL